MFLLCLNVFLLLVGTLMDIFSAIVVVVPLILPLAEIYGINYVHLGIIFVANLELGFLHPPLGPEPAAGVGAVQEAGARGDVGDAADARHPGARRAAHHLRAVADAGAAAVDGAGVTKLEDDCGRGRTQFALKVAFQMLPRCSWTLKNKLFTASAMR